MYIYSYVLLIEIYLLALQCPQPEEHPNSFVIANDLSIGSQATYHCYHGYHASVNTSLSITCQESGKWTSLKGKCSGMTCLSCCGYSELLILKSKSV